VLETGVAGNVAVTVVEEFKVVDVDHDDGNQRITFSFGPYLFDRLIELPAIRKASQGV
jgi:hypothetical protein